MLQHMLYILQVVCIQSIEIQKTKVLAAMLEENKTHKEKKLMRFLC